MLKSLQNIFDSHVNLLRAMLEKSPIRSLQLSVINHTALHRRVTSSSRLLWSKFAFMREKQTPLTMWSASKWDLTQLIDTALSGIRLAFKWGWVWFLKILMQRGRKVPLHDRKQNQSTFKKCSSCAEAGQVTIYLTDRFKIVIHQSFSLANGWPCISQLKLGSIQWYTPSDIP